MSTSKNLTFLEKQAFDHWHALPMIAACMNGKDVFCEKPISHNIMEGRQMVDFATHYKRIVQVGTWQRSQQQFLDAVTYVRSGKLGKINVCRAWKIQAPKAAVLGKVAPSEPPKDVDYDLWVGPAAMVPYQSNRLHYNHRWYYNFAGGMVGDWGVHMMDIVLLGMSKSDNLVQPSKVTSLGGKFYVGPEDDRTTPDTLMTLYNFDNWIMTGKCTLAIRPSAWMADATTVHCSSGPKVVCLSTVPDGASLMHKASRLKSRLQRIGAER
jgi:predicted dehydrogenase